MLAADPAEASTIRPRGVVESRRAPTDDPPGPTMPRKDPLQPQRCAELLAALAAPERLKIVRFLADGPRTARDVWQAAQDEGLSARTLHRAKPGLGIRSRRVHRDGKAVSYWLLRGQELPADPSADPELARLFAELERQYPPPTPLEALDEDY